MPTACRPEQRRRSAMRTRWRARSTSGALDEVRAALGDDSRALRAALRPAARRQCAVRSRSTSSATRICSTPRGDRRHRHGEPARRRRTWPRRCCARVTLFERAQHAAASASRRQGADGWNGLMIAAFARAARVLAGHGGPGGDEDDRGRDISRRATRAAAFLRDTMWDPERALLRRYRQGNAAIDGYAEDYAFLIFGLLELFQASGDAAWLTWALELQARQDELFWDAAAAGGSARPATILGAGAHERGLRRRRAVAGVGRALNCWRWRTSPATRRMRTRGGGVRVLRRAADAARPCRADDGGGAVDGAVGRGADRGRRPARRRRHDRAVAGGASHVPAVRGRVIVDPSTRGAPSPRTCRGWRR